MNSKTILLVEDNINDIELTRRALVKNHIKNKLDVVENGQDALDYLFGKGKYSYRASAKLPTLILLDVNLPGVNGLEVLRCIRLDKHTQHLPVVILTSSKAEQDVAASYNLGVNSYIRKPVDFNQFANAIENLGLYWLVINQPPPIT